MFMIYDCIRIASFRFSKFDISLHEIYLICPGISPPTPKLFFFVLPLLLKSGPLPPTPPLPPLLPGPPTAVSTEGVLLLEFLPLPALASGFIIHQLDFPVPSF